MIQISNDADDGYYNQQDSSGWHSDPQAGGADLVGSWGGLTTAWVTGYRFESTGINSGDTIRTAYLQLVSSDGDATSTACGSAPCATSNSTFRVYGVLQNDGPAFSNATGNTPLDVPYTTSYVDYTTTGPGDDHGSCQGNNNGQNTCTHIIDVSNIVREITSQAGWTNTSAMRFVMLSTNGAGPNIFAGYEDSSANPAKAATLLVNPPIPTIVSSGAWGTSPSETYPTTYATGPFVYPGASTILLFLGDYYDYNGTAVPQPDVTDSCGNTWNVLAGPTDWAGISYDMRGTVYYVQNPASCPAGDTITVTVTTQEPIFLHFLAVAGSNTALPPVASAITSPPPGTYATSATTDSVTLNGVGLLASWIFGDSDSPHTFTPQAGFVNDVNSIPTYLISATGNVASAGSYQNEFAISPTSDGWETILVGLAASTGAAGTPTVTVTPSESTVAVSQAFTVTVAVSGMPTPTGSVILTGGGYTSPEMTLNGGVATFDIPSDSLSLGTDALTASYAPDSESSSIYTGGSGTASVDVVNTVPAAMISPTPGSALGSGTVTFYWSAATGNATNYYLWVGTSPGASDLGGYTISSGLSQTANVPTNGATVYVRLWTQINGTTMLYNDYTYTEASGSAATMISPTSGTTLGSGTVTFYWGAATGNVTGYYLWVGTSPGTSNLGGFTISSGLSQTATLPTTGATVYVRLWTLINGAATLYNDYTYTEASASAAAMISPTAGSTLGSGTVSFYWGAATGNVTGYYLWIGTTPGSSNLGGYTISSGLSQVVNLPTSGATVYVRLWTLINGTATLYNDYTYIEASGSAAAIISPTSGTTLGSGTVTFYWGAASGNVTGYYLWVGTSPGSSNLGGFTISSGLSQIVTLPTTGATVYVRLWTLINGTATLYNDYSYTEASGSAAAMISPTAGSTLGSGTVTFYWGAATGNVTSYSLWIGTSPGTSDLGGFTISSGLSQTVTLPTAGATVYVRLFTLINGTTTLYNDYTYTEATGGSAAAMISPTPGSSLGSGTVIFYWTAATGNVTSYYLWVGTSPGASDLGGFTIPSGLSQVVNLPTNGTTVYVRLWTQINGTTMLYNDYTYGEANAIRGSAAAMISPTPGSTLTSGTTTFTWNAGTGNVTSYYLWVGTSPGTSDLGGFTISSGLSQTVNLPTDGATIYVRLWTLIQNATLVYNDYTYTDAP
jgi:hypothetical protein